MSMSVPMPTGAVKALAATLWVVFTAAVHLATSFRAMAKPAKMWMSVVHTTVAASIGV